MAELDHRTGEPIPVDAGVDLAGLAERINQEHHAAEAALNAGLEHALEAGRLLIEAKRQVGHGEWLPWVEEHFEGTPRTATTYMRLVKRWPEIGNGKRASDLTIRGTVKLLPLPRVRPIGYEGKSRRMQRAALRQSRRETSTRNGTFPNWFDAVDALHNAVMRVQKRWPESATERVSDELRKLAGVLEQMDRLEVEGAEPELEEGVDNGVGVSRGHEAINCLKRIPKNDRLRKRGFQIVTDWIKHNP